MQSRRALFPCFWIGFVFFVIVNVQALEDRSMVSRASTAVSLLLGAFDVVSDGLLTYNVIGFTATALRDMSGTSSRNSSVVAYDEGGGAVMAYYECKDISIEQDWCIRMDFTKISPAYQNRSSSFWSEGDSWNSVVDGKNQTLSQACLAFFSTSYDEFSALHPGSFCRKSLGDVMLESDCQLGQGLLRGVNGGFGSQGVPERGPFSMVAWSILCAGFIVVTLASLTMHLLSCWVLCPQLRADRVTLAYDGSTVEPKELGRRPVLADVLTGDKRCSLSFPALEKAQTLYLSYLTFLYADAPALALLGVTLAVHDPCMSNLASPVGGQFGTLFFASMTLNGLSAILSFIVLRCRHNGYCRTAKGKYVIALSDSADQIRALRIWWDEDGPYVKAVEDTIDYFTSAIGYIRGALIIYAIFLFLPKNTLPILLGPGTYIAAIIGAFFFLSVSSYAVAPTVAPLVYPCCCRWRGQDFFTPFSVHKLSDNFPLKEFLKRSPPVPLQDIEPYILSTQLPPTVA